MENNQKSEQSDNDSFNSDNINDKLTIEGMLQVLDTKNGNQNGSQNQQAVAQEGGGQDPKADRRPRAFQERPKSGQDGPRVAEDQT